jgi:hypothetical protein
LSGADLPFVLRPVRLSKAREDENIKQPCPKEPPQIDYYLLVGECYVEGLMSGEAVAAVSGDNPSEFSGPVPFQLLDEDILSTANQPHKVRRRSSVWETERIEMKQARLPAGGLFTPAMLEAARRNKAEKRWFDIH